MSYNIVSLGNFRKQVDRESEKSRKIIYEKIRLIEENPYRLKRIYSKRFGKAFRVRLNLDRREVRMIYVILVCLLDRKRDYKDLEKYLDRL